MAAESSAPERATPALRVSWAVATTLHTWAQGRSPTLYTSWRTSTIPSFTPEWPTTSSAEWWSTAEAHDQPSLIVTTLTSSCTSSSSEHPDWPSLERNRSRRGHGPERWRWLSLLILGGGICLRIG